MGHYVSKTLHLPAGFSNVTGALPGPKTCQRGREPRYSLDTELRDRNRLPEPKMSVRCSKIGRSAGEALGMPRGEEESDCTLAQPLTKEQREAALKAEWEVKANLGAPTIQRSVMERRIIPY